MPPVSTHREIIKAIDAMMGRPFAIAEIRKKLAELNISVSSIVRCLTMLQTLGLVKHTPGRYLHRNYQTTFRWQAPADVIEAFEYGKALKI